MEVSPVAKELKRLREHAGYGLRAFATLIGMSPSGYQYYETRFKRAYLPVEFVETIAPRLVGLGTPPITMGNLVSLYTSTPMVSQSSDATEVVRPLDEPVPSLIASHMPRDVPVLGTASAGAAGDFTIMNGDTVDYVRRTPRIMGRKDVFALWVRSDSMSPWREPGALIYCEAARAPQNGDYVVLEMAPEPGNDFRAAFLKRLVSSGGDTYKVLQYNPPLEYTIPKRDVQAVYRVLDWSELLGV